MTPCTVETTVYDHCLAYTGAATPIWLVAALGVALVMMGVGSFLLTRADEAQARALAARRRGHLL